MAEPGQELIWGNCIRCNLNVDFPKISSRKKHFIGNAIIDLSLPKVKKKKKKNFKIRADFGRAPKLSVSR